MSTTFPEIHLAHHPLRTILNLGQDRRYAQFLRVYVQPKRADTYLPKLSATTPV
jgi:hypothetical protein